MITPASALFEIQTQSHKWNPIPCVDEAQMREVDRIAVEEFGLGILQMMENAGHNLATSVVRFLDKLPGARVTVFAGSGGNGGGGLCAARHLHNRGASIAIILSRTGADLSAPARVQLKILQQAGLKITLASQAESAAVEADLILDALIGYSLKGAPTGKSADLIEIINRSGKTVLSLDLPSGLDASTGGTPGVCVQANQTLTLALPKPGLINPIAGRLFLTDIGIPPEVFTHLGITLPRFWKMDTIRPIRRKIK